LGSLRLQGRPGGAAGIRGEAPARVQGQIVGDARATSGAGMSDEHWAGHPFVTPQRERLAEAVRHLVDATLTIEDATEEQLGTAADMTEAVARHLGREPRDDDRGVRGRTEDGHTDYLCRSPLVGVVSPVAPPMTWTTDDDGLHMR